MIARVVGVAVAYVLACGGACLALVGEPEISDGVLRWCAGASQFTAAPAAGARLLSWDFTRKDGTIWRVVFPVEMPRDGNLALVRGGIPVLFPFAGPSETEDGKFAWRDERGARHPMPMHGFARQSRFELLERTAAGFRARLSPDAVTYEAYPFRYTFEVSYVFAERSIVCELTLRNDDKVRIPWSAGLHPYFTVPGSERVAASDYQIWLSSRRAWKRKGRSIEPQPALTFPRRLEDPCLRATFWSELALPSCVFGSAESAERIEVVHDLSRFPTACFVVWTEGERAPFYCVEPFMGPTNAAETGVGLYWVEPGERATFRIEIRLCEEAAQR